jgi:hypothetical protein
MNIHFLVWEEGIPLVGEEVEFPSGYRAAVAMLRKCYALRPQRTFIISHSCAPVTTS